MAYYGQQAASGYGQQYAPTPSTSTRGQASGAPSAGSLGPDGKPADYVYCTRADGAHG